MIAAFSQISEITAAARGFSPPALRPCQCEAGGVLSFLHHTGPSARGMTRQLGAQNARDFPPKPCPGLAAIQPRAFFGFEGARLKHAGIKHLRARIRTRIDHAKMRRPA